MESNVSPQLAGQLNAANRTIHILWVALMASVTLYGVVMFLVTTAQGIEPTPLGVPPFVFPMLAAVLAATGFLIYRQMTSPDRLRALLADPRPVPANAALSEAEGRLLRVPGLVFTASIIRWALFESTAILGLVLGITDRSLESFLPYGIAAIALMAATPPKLRQLTVDASRA